MSGFVPLNAGYTVSVRRTRLNALVLLTLALDTTRRTRDRSITRSLQS